MSYKIYAGIQTGVDTWATKACIYDPGDYSETKKLLSPTLTREVGKAGSLEFTVPLGNVAHSALQKMRTVVEVRQDDKLIWQGRVMSHEQDFLMRQKFYCEGELAYLNDSSIPPYTARNLSFSQLLEWVCANHNGMVDSYKAFTPGNVQMDTPMIVPYYDGCTVAQVGSHYDSDDGDYYYHWGMKDPLDSSKYLFYEETESNKASCLSWPLNEEHLTSTLSSDLRVSGGWVLSRIGDNQFRARLTVAYANEKTYTASVKIEQALASCATCKKDYGTHSIYDITEGTESTTYKITQQNGKYSLAVNGKTDDRFLFDVKEPVYDFHSSTNGHGVTWDILQEILLDKYGGYLMIRHESRTVTILGRPVTLHWRYLDYLQEITDKNSQTIAFGTNLLDLTNYTKAEDIVTRVMAIGTIKWGWFGEFSDTAVVTANDETAQKLYGVVTRLVLIEGRTTTQQELLDAAEEELAKHLRYLNGITVNAVDLKDAGIDVERLAFGKMTHIYSAPHGVDTWLLLSKLIEPLDAPDKKEFTLGIEFPSISDLQALSARKATNAYDLSRSIKGYITSS